MLLNSRGPILLKIDTQTVSDGEARSHSLMFSKRWIPPWQARWTHVPSSLPTNPPNWMGWEQIAQRAWTSLLTMPP
jgi:hypothetical protein